MRIGGVPIGDFWNTESSHSGWREGENVGVAEGSERIGHRISGDSGEVRNAVGVFIGDAGKGRQPAKLKVERAVFDVVEHPEAPAHDELAAPKRVPGKAE